MVVDSNNKQEVDINDFFEKSEVDEKIPCHLYHGRQMEDENEANRRQMRIKRGLYLFIALLILMFFIGLIVTIIGSVYMSEKETKGNRMREHHSSAQSLVQTNLIEPFSEPNSSFDRQTDLTPDSSDVVVDSNELLPLRPTVITATPTTEPITTERTTTEFDYMPFERQLEELAPDTSLQRFLNRLRNSRNDLKLEDIPPAIDDVMQYMRRLLRIPQIRFEFE